MSISISITNTVKSNKKINETAQTANFNDFPLIFCRNDPKWAVAMQTQTHFSKINNTLLIQQIVQIVKTIPGSGLKKKNIECKIMKVAVGLTEVDPSVYPVQNCKTFPLIKLVC